MNGWETHVISPTTVLDFYEWFISKGTPMVLKLSTEKDYKRMRLQDYRFYGQCINTFEVLFSGTFLLRSKSCNIFPQM